MSLPSRLHGWFKRKRLERDIDDELRSHLEMRAEDNVRAGMFAREARDDAKRRFGSSTLLKEATRDLDIVRWLESLAQDLRFGLRTLRKNPAFTAVAALTLALGIGANTAIFSIVDGVLLRPLPSANSEQLVMVWEHVRVPHYENSTFTPAPGNYADWNAQTAVFREMAAYQERSWSLTGVGEPVRVLGEGVTASLFSVLQVAPAIGRVFSSNEDRPDGPRVAIVGYGLWRERFGGDPGILGRTMYLDEAPYAVVGVMPAGYHFPDPDDQVWIPMALTARQLADRRSHYLNVVARLRPRTSIQQAQAAMAVIAQHAAAQYPDSNTGVGVNVVSLREQRNGDLRRPLLVLSGVVGFLLLMVCSNVASLVLARARVRGREFAIRAALVRVVGAWPANFSRKAFCWLCLEEFWDWHWRIRE